jgi:predicted deacylase
MTQRRVLHAPEQGVIISICVQPGDTVVAGQVLLMQEAMKMELPLQAPTAGRISAVLTARVMWIGWAWPAWIAPPLRVWLGSQAKCPWWVWSQGDVLPATRLC